MRRTVAVISKAGCHLCEGVLRALAELSSRYDFEVQVLDIMNDPSLHDRYWMKIPVVRIDGVDILDASDIGPDADWARGFERLLGA